MRKLFTSALFTILFLGSVPSFAGLVGSKSIPSPFYPSLAVAIDSLNLYGVGPLGVTFTVNYALHPTETAPSGSYVLGSDVLNSSLSVTNPVRFKCNGLLVTANTGSGSNDAIFTIQGADYVTVDSLYLQESSANTTATSMMERGFSIVKRTNDGCKTISIRYCQVTLNNTNSTAASGIAPLGATGIFVGNCTYLSNTSVAATSDSGTHDNMFFTKNIIKNVNHGIYFQGDAVTADGSAFNDRTTYSSENVIENFTHNGMFFSYFSNDYLDHNMINNTASGGTAPTANNIFGIRYYNPITTLQTHNSWTCTKNVIDLTTNTSGTSYSAVGIFSQIIGNGTTDITNDTISLNSQGSSAMLAGIFCGNNLGTQNVTGNRIHDFQTKTTNEQAVFGIFVGGYSTYTGLGLSTIEWYPDQTTTSNNIIEDFNVSSGVTTTNNRVVAILDDNIKTSSSTIVKNVKGNTISNIELNDSCYRFTGYGGIWSYGAFNPSVTHTTNFENNSFSDIYVTNSTDPTPLYVVNPLGTYYHGHTFNSDDNNISGISSGTGWAIGFNLEYELAVNMDKDTITDIYSDAWHAYGIMYGATAYNPKNVSVSNSLIQNISSGGAASAGSISAGAVFAAGATAQAAEVTFKNNLISDISNDDPAGFAYGIASSNGTATFNIYNNMVSEIVAGSNTTSFSSSIGIALDNTGTNNVFYNTVKMINASAASTAGYGATGLFYAPGATNTIQNNILHVNVIAGSANSVAAMRGRAGVASSAPALSSFKASSNIYFAPTGSNNYLYVEGTSNTGLVNGYHLSGLTASTTKNIVNDPYFNSDCDKSLYHNFMQGASPTREEKTYTEDNLAGSGGIYVPSGLSYAESAATDVSVSTDFELSTRPAGSSDIGALEFAGSVRPDMDIVITSSTGYDTACVFNLPYLSVSIPSFFNRVSYQWYRDTTKISGATFTTFTVTPVSGDYTVRVYDSVTGCEYASVPYHMTIVPPPPAMITYYDSLAFCQGSAVVLQANKGYRYTYQWSRNSTVLSGETNDHLVVDESGDYTVEVNTPLGCPSYSTPIRIKVYPLPTPTVLYAGPRVLTTQKYFLYQWYKNNVKIDSFAQNRSYYVMEDGAYTVEVTDSNGCTAKSDVFLFSLGIDPQAVQAAVKVYPNPVSSILNIESPVPVQAVISDITGRAVFTSTGAQKHTTIDMSSMAKGIYLLMLNDEEGNLIVTQKVNKD